MPKSLIVSTLKRVSVFSLVVVALVCACSTGYAQTLEEVPIQVPSWDFATLSSTLLTELMTVVKYALGIGISVFLVTLIWGAFKRFGRG
jgi:hypothetical protein